MENQNMGNVRSGRSIGPVIGLIVIIAIILLGGIYFWTMRSSDDSYNNTSNGQEQNNNNGSLNTSASVNTSVPDSYNSTEIEQSLNETDPEDVDTSTM